MGWKWDDDDYGREEDVPVDQVAATVAYLRNSMDHWLGGYFGEPPLQEILGRLDGSEVQQVGINAMCMERRQPFSHLLAQMENQEGLRSGLPPDQDNFGYLLAVPGSSDMTYAILVLTCLSRLSLRARKRIECVDVLFSTHSDCAMKAAGLELNRESGAKDFIAAYKLFELAFPSLFIGRPRLIAYYIQLDGINGASRELTFPDAWWEEVKPFVPTLDAVYRLLERLGWGGLVDLGRLLKI